MQTRALPLGYGAVNRNKKTQNAFINYIYKYSGANMPPKYFFWSGRRDSNSRRSPWQGDALPLSHSRIWRCLNNIKYYSTSNIFCQYFFCKKIKIWYICTLFEFPICILLYIDKKNIAYLNVIINYDEIIVFTSKKQLDVEIIR